MADLSGVLAKLDRAEEHRQEYDDLVEEFVASDPYSIYTEYDPKSGWHTVRWLALREPPVERLGLVFGDMVSNLRATLDYLVWQLVLVGGKRPGGFRSCAARRTGRYRAGRRCAASSDGGWTRSRHGSRTTEPIVHRCIRWRSWTT